MKRNILVILAVLALVVFGACKTEETEVDAVTDTAVVATDTDTAMDTMATDTMATDTMATDTMSTDMTDTSATSATTATETSGTVSTTNT
jgi:hypothetical protein